MVPTPTKFVLHFYLHSTHKVGSTFCKLSRRILRKFLASFYAVLKTVFRQKIHAHSAISHFNFEGYLHALRPNLIGHFFHVNLRLFWPFLISFCSRSPWTAQKFSADNFVPTGTPFVELFNFLVPFTWFYAHLLRRTLQKFSHHLVPNSGHFHANFVP